MTRYSKLVRDRIPEIIEREGRACVVEKVSNDEFLRLLDDKLLEEAKEVVEAASDDKIGELADLFEVLDAILEARAIDREAVLAAQRERRERRGGFRDRLKLLEAY